MKKIVDSLQGLPLIKNNLDDIAVHILGHKDDKRVPKLKKSIQYYLDGAKDNVTKCKPKFQEKNKNTLKGKNESIPEFTDIKKLGSESLNSQVIFFILLVYNLIFMNTINFTNNDCSINMQFLI